MSMHLCGPALTLNGKRKGKVKFRNAAEAQRARELDASWKEILKAQGVADEQRKRTRAMKAEPLQYNLSSANDRANTRHIPSLDTGHTGALRTRDIPKYTGTELIGISQMAKSNAVPVFNSDHIIEIARMRR
jgi:hypothetical protein